MTSKKGSPRVTLDNRLPPGYTERPVLEAAILSAFADMSGPWEVFLESPSTDVLMIGVVAPDGSAWSMSHCRPEQSHQPESIAAIVDTVRAACRRRWLSVSRAGRGSRGKSGSNEQGGVVDAGGGMAGRTPRNGERTRR